MVKKRETKSPIKNLPVRMPGQSGREALDSLLDDQVMPWFLAAGLSVVIAMLEWLRAYFNAPPTPWVYTILAVCIIFGAVRKFKKALVIARCINLGRHGEEAVGQYLDEKLRPMGCNGSPMMSVVHWTRLRASSTATRRTPPTNWRFSAHWRRSHRRSITSLATNRLAVSKSRCTPSP